MSDTKYMIDRIELLAAQLERETVKHEMISIENNKRFRKNKELKASNDRLGEGWKADVNRLNKEAQEMEYELDIEKTKVKNWYDSYEELRVKYSNSQRGCKQLREQVGEKEIQIKNLLTTLEMSKVERGES